MSCEALDVVSQACRGLDYAHRNGVVHRDVKPGNLLVSDSDVVKLADFGIARATDQSSITQVGSVLGTAAYLSPEQARGEEAGPQADIYSLGVVTYQLMSGRLPYEATSLSELALKQQRESPEPLEQLSPHVPRELAQSVALALAIDPQRRPQDASAMADMLRNGARGISPLPPGTADGRRATGAATRVLPDRGPRETNRTGRRQQLPPDPQDGYATAATRVSGRKAQPPPRSAQPAPGRGSARPVPARRPQPTRAPARQQGGRRWARRLTGLLALALVVGAAIAVAIVISKSTSSSVVKARTIMSHDFQDAYNQLTSLINQYTK